MSRVDIARCLFPTKTCAAAQNMQDHFILLGEVNFWEDCDHEDA